MKAFTTISTLVALVATFASAAPTGEVESLERRGEYSPVALDPSCIIDAPCLRTANVGTVDQCKAICNFEEECKSIVTYNIWRKGLLQPGLYCNLYAKHHTGEDARNCGGNWKYDDRYSGAWLNNKHV